jgi:hypothetical protein
LQGVTGLSGVGSTGLQGAQGDTGLGTQGSTGTAGTQGVTGLSGVGSTGLQGLQGQTGTIGPQGTTGITGAGVTGLQGQQGDTGVGTAGVTGSGTQGVTGTQGIQGVTGIGGGGGGSATIYSTTQRYATDTGTDTETYVLSSSEVYTGLSWTRSGTTLTVSRSSHGLSTGNRVIIFDTNESYLNAVITSTNAGDFSVTCNNTGGTSGSAGAHTVGVTTAIAANKLSITLPTAANVKIISLRFRGSTTAGGVFDIEIPSGSLENGVGGITSRNNVNIPTFRVTADTDTLIIVAATIAVNNASVGYDGYRFGGAGASSVRLFSLNF